VLNVYCTGHRWSEQVCKPFAAGAEAPIVPVSQLLPGDCFFYGALRGTLPTLRRAQQCGRTWYYGDNGYFRAGKKEGCYFRITRNDLQHDGSGELPRPHWQARERWERLGLTIQPWRADGGHILICPPARLFGATFGFSADKWLHMTLKTLGKYTKRELRVRAKVKFDDTLPYSLVDRKGRPEAPVPTNFTDDLAGAWALVTHSSNVAVEALLAGVPVFCTDRCGASAMASNDLHQIENPRMDGNRLKWASVLANNQWTLAEMRDGTCWRMLNEAA